MIFFWIHLGKSLFFMDGKVRRDFFSNDLQELLRICAFLHMQFLFYHPFLILYMYIYIYILPKIEEDVLVDKHDVSHGLNNHQLDMRSFLAGELS